MPAQYLSTGPLGGLNEDENPMDLVPGELDRATNVERRGETVGTRSGTKMDTDDYATQLTGGAPIQGLYEMRKDFDANRQLLSIAQFAGDTDLHTASGAHVATSAAVAISSVATVLGNTWTFAEHANRVWAAGGLRGASGATAGNDDFWHYDGTTVTNMAILLGAADAVRGLRPTHVASYRNYLLVNGLRGGTLASDNPACTRYSQFGDDPTLAASWPSGNTLGFSATRAGVDSYGPTFTTGFGSYTDNRGSWLLVLTNKALFSYQLDPDGNIEFHFTDSIANGCVHQNAYIPLGLDSGDAVYVSNFGIHSLRQSQQHGSKSNSFLSWKIRKTFATMNRSRTQAIVGAFDSLNGRAIIAIPTGSSTVPDKLLVLDVKDQLELTADTARWYIWQMRGFHITSLFYGRSVAGLPRMYFGTDDGRIGFFDDQTLTDLGAVGGAAERYPSNIRTRHDAAGYLQIEKHMGDVYVIGTASPSAAADYNVSYRTVFDFGRLTSKSRNIRLFAGASLTLPVTLPATLPGDPLPRPARIYATGSGQTISHEISANSQSPFYISSIDYSVDIAGEGMTSDEAA